MSGCWGSLFPGLERSRSISPLNPGEKQSELGPAPPLGLTVQATKPRPSGEHPATPSFLGAEKTAGQTTSVRQVSPRAGLNLHGRNWVNLVHKRREIEQRQVSSTHNMGLPQRLGKPGQIPATYVISRGSASQPVSHGFAGVTPTSSTD
jgi:hypothetical protein